MMYFKKGLKKGSLVVLTLRQQATEKLFKPQNSLLSKIFRLGLQIHRILGVQ